jgi:hypothetical protein
MRAQRVQSSHNEVHSGPIAVELHILQQAENPPARNSEFRMQIHADF